MVISKKFITVFSKEIWKEISNYIEFDSELIAYSFNIKKLNEKKWVFAAMDDNSIDVETGELNRIITHTSYSKIFILLI